MKGLAGYEAGERKERGYENRAVKEVLWEGAVKPKGRAAGRGAEGEVCKDWRRWHWWH